jgi:chemotaxis protein methyltransferase CheR
VATSGDSDIELHEEEFRLLRDFIHDRLGLFFEDGQRVSLKARLQARLVSLDLASFEDYYRYLRYGPRRSEEFARMVSHVTNNETYFFREPAQLKVFSTHVLRTLKERKSATGERRLRLLSAGCSTGEEPHTLAMLVYDSGQFFWGWAVEVVGLDVDEAALAKARRGVYFHNSFRGVAADVLERHFLVEGSGRRVKDSVRRMVGLRLGNLVDAASFAALAPLDAIFCRNVLIYFSEASIRRVVELFYDALAPGGFLMLGHAESLSRVSDRFTPVRFPGAMVYEKPGVAG